MLRVEDLTKVYEKGGRGRKETVRAVDDVSFDCNPGEIFGLLGPNGAGKTTTLRCISTLIKPTSGNVYIDRYNVLEHEKTIRSRIGFLTSDMKLDGFFTPGYMMDYFGSLNKMAKEEIGRMKDLLFNELQMNDFVDKKIDKLSTGMKQKTAIAISLIHDPEVIVFDEPTNGLDVITSKSVTDFLRKQAGNGKTVLISTHIMSIAEKLCSRFGILVKGEIKELGTLKQILDRNSTDSLEDVFFGYVLPEGGSGVGHAQ
ncbi:MAG: ABC transporter ATP-binding protein [Candidatus Fermentibacteraceae bacterium]|nr:ABC transporter ATP-binding protein [Candidatus Fermentibacteraceae bacterium]MBN2608414.1 ABC transporter ATP-binding protein [Candidatus Fermentibacteraceae bacterium]